MYLPFPFCTVASLALSNPPLTAPQSSQPGSEKVTVQKTRVQCGSVGPGCDLRNVNR